MSLDVVASEDIELAVALISQNDCENAIPILLAADRSKLKLDRKKILLNLSFCAEQTQNYSLKKLSELSLLKIDPTDVITQLKYLDSLFYLSKYSSVLTYSNKNKSLRNYFDFWIIRARALLELNKCDQAIRELDSFLKTAKLTRKAEVYYWLGQCHSLNEDYDQARDSYKLALAEKYSPPWLKKSIDELMPQLKEKNRRFSAKIRLQYGYDSNILRENLKIRDSTQLVDLNLDYVLLKKKKNVMSFGVDLNFQDYSNNHKYQTATSAPRMSQNLILTEKFKFEYSLSAGKILTNGKADQNFMFVSTLAFYRLTNSLQLQPSINYFQNLNNNPVKQLSILLLLNYYSGNDVFWIGPFLKRSDSPAPTIDSTSFSLPVLTASSLTTRYSQYGIITGYVKSLTENSSLQMQYSINKTQFASIDTSQYNQNQVAGKTERRDTNQNLKGTFNFSLSRGLQLHLAASVIHNSSQGFQGFFSTTAPTNSYEASQVLTGVTYKFNGF